MNILLIKFTQNFEKKTQSILTGWRFFSLLFLIIGNLVFSLSIAASVGSSQLSDRVSRQLLYVNKLMDQKKYLEAQKRLVEIAEKSRLHDYEAAVVYQTLGYVYAENDDNKNTIRAFEKSLSYDVLSESIQQSLRLNLGQLYLSLGEYKKGTSIIELWRKGEKASSRQIHELLAVGYYHQQKYRASLRHLKQIMKNDSEINQSYYQLAIAVHFELSLFREFSKLLQRAVKLFPQEKSFWRQLAYVYRELGQIQNAVSTLTLAYHSGLLNADDVLVLARLYLSQEMPYKAAELIQKETERGLIPVDSKNMLLLARSWRMARELENAALSYATLATLEKEGDAYYHQAEVYLEMRLWNSAAIALEQALDKGIAKNKGRAYLYLGVAQYELNQLDSAKRALQQAAKTPSLNSQAEQWMQLVNSSREEQMAMCALKLKADCSGIALH